MYKSSNIISLLDVPNDVLRLILGRCNLTSLVRIGGSCRRLHRMVTSMMQRTIDRLTFRDCIETDDLYGYQMLCPDQWHWTDVETLLRNDSHQILRHWLSRFRGFRTDDRVLHREWYLLLARGIIHYRRWQMLGIMLQDARRQYTPSPPLALSPTLPSSARVERSWIGCLCDAVLTSGSHEAVIHLLDYMGSNDGGDDTFDNVCILDALQNHQETDYLTYQTRLSWVIRWRLEDTFVREKTFMALFDRLSMDHVYFDMDRLQCALLCRRRFTSISLGFLHRLVRYCDCGATSETMLYARLQLRHRSQSIDDKRSS